MLVTDYIQRDEAMERIKEIARRKEAEMKDARPERAEELTHESNGLNLALIALRLI